MSIEILDLIREKGVTFGMEVQRTSHKVRAWMLDRNLREMSVVVDTIPEARRVIIHWYIELMT